VVFWEAEARECLRRLDGRALRVCSARAGMLTLVFVPQYARSGSVSERVVARFQITGRFLVV
jgi:hypothetical protein